MLNQTHPYWQYFGQCTYLIQNTEPLKLPQIYFERNNQKWWNWSKPKNGSVYLLIYFRFINTLISRPIPEQPLLFFCGIFSFFLTWLKFRELDGNTFEQHNKRTIWLLPPVQPSDRSGSSFCRSSLDCASFPCWKWNCR